MNILVTGGTGYIGSYIAEEMTGRGHNVTVVARGSKAGSTSATRLSELQAQGIKAVFADLSKPGELRTQLETKDFDVIV